MKISTKHNKNDWKKGIWHACVTTDSLRPLLKKIIKKYVGFRIDMVQKITINYDAVDDTCVNIDVTTAKKPFCADLPKGNCWDICYGCKGKKDKLLNQK
jgi:hypothetical protein